jgi:hypothetical protein
MNHTTAPGSSGGNYVDDNPSGGIVGTLLIAADRNLEKNELCNVAEGAGLTLSSVDATQVLQAVKRITKENGKELGELYFLQEKKSPVGFSVANQDTYFPGFCLTSFDSVATLAAANYPLLVPWLRARKQIFMEGLTGELTALPITNWAIAANVVTLTASNTAANIAWMNALIEDKNVHGSYTNWRTVTLASAIGNVTAGTYAITEVDSVNRYIKFALTAGNASGSITASVEFYPFRIAGSDTTAREFSMRGLSISGQGDGNFYMLNGLRRRGFMQGHIHDEKGGEGAGSTKRIVVDSSGTATPTTAVNSPTTNPISDGVNGTPRTGLETHSPLASSHIYRHAGRYIA